MKLLNNLYLQIERIADSLSKLSEATDKLTTISKSLQYLDSWAEANTGVGAGQFMIMDASGSIGLNLECFDCLTGQLIDINAKNARKVYIVSKDNQSIATRYTVSPKQIKESIPTSDGGMLMMHDVAENYIVTNLND